MMTLITLVAALPVVAILVWLLLDAKSVRRILLPYAVAFLCVLAAWLTVHLLGGVFLSLWTQEWGYFIALSVLGLYAAPFTFIGWLVFVNPVVFFRKLLRFMFRPWWSLLWGALAGLGVFAVTVGWFYSLEFAGPMLAIPVGIGAISLRLFSHWYRTHELKNSATG